MTQTTIPAFFAGAGLTPETILEIDHLTVGVGGLVRELLAFTSGVSSIKDASRQRVTVADTMADRLLRRSLVELVPASSGFSEEGGQFGVRSTGLHVRWLVDPLDGTRSATLGGVFAISVSALVMDGARALGAIGWLYIPNLGALYRGVVADGYRDCRVNGDEASAAPLSADDLRRRYAAVGSDWSLRRTADIPMKITAPGAAAIHLAMLVNPASDVAAAFLSRYKPYDASAGLVIAAAGGCSAYALDERAKPGALLDPLEFIRVGTETPDAYAPFILVCRAEVAEALR